MSSNAFIPINWGAPTAAERGPIIIRDGAGFQRNVIGAWAWPYAIFHAIAEAKGEITPRFRPDFSRSAFMPLPRPLSEADSAEKEGTGVFDPTKPIEHDAFGYRPHLSFRAIFDNGAQIKQTVTAAPDEIRIERVARDFEDGRIKADGILISERGHVLCTKIATNPVWHLPSIAKAYGISESELRGALFQATNNPDFLDRPELEVYLPPYEGSSFYVFGDLRRLANPETKIGVRIHDACKNSDVHDTTRCTCKAYMDFAKEEGVRIAQEGGVFILVYRNFDGRALGELIKTAVYASRASGGLPDLPKHYFQHTVDLAGCEDVRPHEIISDPLHLLGITRIDYLFSMSKGKYENLVRHGIDVVHRIALPPDYVPWRAHEEVLGKTGVGGYFNGKFDYAREAAKAGYVAGIGLESAYEGIPRLLAAENTFNLSRCALTGADDKVDISELNELSARFPFAEMALLWDPDKAGTARCPSRDWLSEFIETYQGQKALHLCNRGLFEFINQEGETPAYLEHFQRIQLNLRYDKAPGNYDPMKLVAQIKNHPDKEFILQLGEEEKALLPLLRGLENVSVFYDTSAGSGVKPDVYQAPIEGFKTGYAGGLTPDNLTEELRRIRMTAPNATTWVDAESGLRTENRFDMRKARRFLTIAEAFVTIENRRAPAHRKGYGHNPVAANI